MAATITQQIKEVAREIAVRRRVYPRWVADGRLDADTAHDRIETLEAVLRTLLDVEARSTPSLFDSPE